MDDAGSIIESVNPASGEDHCERALHNAGRV